MRSGSSKSASSLTKIPDDIDDRLDEDAALIPRMILILPKTNPQIRPRTKVGRNDPCPCSSGKKYKPAFTG
jgi:uncharacterized protein YecA (UPF0149 family)